MAFDAAKEITRCKHDFLYFCRKYLKIVSKTAKLIALHPRPEQLDVIERLELNPWLYILKARQIGYTTIMAARLFHRCLFNPNHRVAVTAQDEEAARAIFEKYSTFYDHLPDFLKFPLTTKTTTEMAFFHGGYIRAATADSNKWHGSTYHDIHATEFSRYRDVEKFVKAVFQTAGPNASIVLETTANGHNEAKKLWDQEDDGFEKHFVPWTAHKQYSLRVKPKGLRITKEIKAYAKEHGLTRGQMFWAQKTLNGKCFKKWRTFKEQYPNTAEEAFVSSGDRVFPDRIYFSGAQARPGLHRYVEKPVAYHIYTIGCDTASGAVDGDYSAFHVLDVTNKDLPRTVSAYYSRSKPYDFSVAALAEAKHWGALAVIEDNSYGAAVAEHFVQQGYAHLYRRVKHDKIEDRWLSIVGFQTNVKTRPILIRRLYEAIVENKLTVIDETLQGEINSFVYDLKSKPVADTGHHDDMIIATALALAGMDQIDVLVSEVEAQRPTNIREMLEFELAMGKIYTHGVGSSHRAMLQTVERSPIREVHRPR
ncbi:MAG: hypothetical protein GY911_11870 [Actinomycetales bacterium]|nr:hypothetical protein [Actinomycetales bacterium]